MKARTPRLLALLIAALLVTLGAAGHASAAEAGHPAAVAAPAVQTAAAAEHKGAGPAPGGIWGDTACRSIVGTFSPILAEVCSPAGKAAVKIAAKKAYQELQDSIVGDMARASKDLAGGIIKGLFTWWMTTDSVQLQKTGLFGDPPSDGNDGWDFSDAKLHGLAFAIGQMIALLLCMFQAIRAMLQRKGAPLAAAFKGLGINALVAAVGVTVIDSLIVGMDRLTEAVLTAGLGSSDDIIATATRMLLPTMGNPLGALAAAQVVTFLGVMQAGLLFLRQAAIPAQAMMLSIAGSGQIGGESTQQWLPKLFTATLTVISYKPLAAMIVVIGFAEVQKAPDFVDYMRGIVTLALAVVALPAMMKIFAPIGARMAGASGGGLGSAVMAAGTALAFSGGGGGAGGGAGGGSSSAVDQARHMDAAGPSGGGGQNGGAAQGSGASSAVQQAQHGSGTGDSAPDEAGTGDSAPADAGTATAGQGAQAVGTAAKTTGGPMSVAVVAAETAHKGVQEAGKTVAGGEGEK